MLDLPHLPVLCRQRFAPLPRIGIGSYRTAWVLCHRNGEAMGNDAFEGPTLFGVVEVDEALVGGKWKKVDRGCRKNKTWVAGAIQRGGQVRLSKIHNMQKKTLHDFISKNIRDLAEAIYTDELAAYLGIEDNDTRHETVNQSEEEWVGGDVHTNGIESVWALFKRSIVGAFHKISNKHLDRHVAEMEWRFNNRNNPHMFRDTVKRILTTDTLRYEQLVADKKRLTPRVLGSGPEPFVWKPVRRASC